MARKSGFAAVYLLVILWVNAYICRDLFFTEYTGHLNSIQGLWISIARLAGEQWFRPAWWPYQDAGEPFERTSMPLVPAATALYAKLGHVSAPRAFNGVTGIVYCLGPLTLFLLAWRLTRSSGDGFWAALAYSLISPTHALIHDPHFNRRLYQMVVWDEVPHAAAICLLPLVVVSLSLALERRRPIWYALTAVAIALTVAASLFGAIAILVTVVCLLCVQPRKELTNNLLRTAAMGFVAWCLICPFLPPSSLDWLAPRAASFLPEMEFAMVLAAVFPLRAVIDRLPRGVRVGLALLVLAIGAGQTIRQRQFAKTAIWPVDITKTVEYRVARWVDANMPGRRVMASGSIAQWFNVFADSPQLAGGSDFTTPNWSIEQATADVVKRKGSGAGAHSLLWLKAFGIQAVAVTSPTGKEFWIPYDDPKKFDGLLPVLWSEDAVTIYRVPRRTESLAHVIPPAAIARPDALELYATALDDPALPAAGMRWENFHQFRVRTSARPEQVISVQTGYHPGWHASVNGRDVDVGRDGLGLLVIHPQCNGPCEIEMNYDGGFEYRFCRALSMAALLCLALYTAKGTLLSTR